MTEESFSASLLAYRERIAKECEARHIDEDIYKSWLEEDAPAAFIWKVPVSMFVTQMKDRYIEQLVQAHKVFAKPTKKGVEDV